MIGHVIECVKSSRIICRVVTSAVVVFSMFTPTYGSDAETGAALPGDTIAVIGRNGANFSFEVGQNCAVTVHADRSIRRVAFRNGQGRTVYERGVRRGVSSVTFADQLIDHPLGTISIRTRDGVWTRLRDASINLAVADCVEPEPIVDWGTCPCVAEGGAWTSFFGQLYPQTAPPGNHTIFYLPGGALDPNNSDHVFDATAHFLVPEVGNNLIVIKAYQLTDGTTFCKINGLGAIPSVSRADSIHQSSIEASDEVAGCRYGLNAMFDPYVESE